MASRDLTSQFVDYRNAANLRRRSSIDVGGAHGSGLSKTGSKRAISKKGGVGVGVLGRDGSDDLLLHVEDGDGSSYRVKHGHSHHHHHAHAALPPKWVDDVDAVHNSIAEITRLVGVLGSLHASRLGSVFGKDLEDKEGQIERLTRDITDRFREAERMLQRVGAATKRAGGEEATIGANVQRSLAKKLQELSADFRQAQRKYLRDVQLQKGSAAAAQSEAQFGIDVNDTSHSHHHHHHHQPTTYDDVGTTTTGLAIVDDLQMAVQSRDVEIARIAQSIEELGSIFKELAVLVIDQGTILDRIDYNMEAVVEHTREGISQLEKAETRQKSARPVKCIACLLSTIAVLLIILILKHR